ncbi:MAG: hypothetical protein WCY25_06780 [Moheibacter sp.]
MNPNYKALLIGLIYISSCTKDIHVANLKNNQLEFKGNQEEILSRWNEAVKSHNLKGILDTLEVRRDSDTLNQVQYFYLLGRSSNDSLKMAQLLVKYKHKLYLKNDTILSCICYDCPSAQPKMSFDNWGWYCESDDIIHCKKIIDLKF